MTVPASRQRRLQIPDDKASDAARLNPGPHDGMSASDDLWVRNFMARLAATLRRLGPKP